MIGICRESIKKVYDHNKDLDDKIKEKSDVVNSL